jgi:Flp pilus assembly protein TadG
MRQRTAQRSTSARRGSAGTAMVEFALVLPLLLTLVLGIADFGKAFNYWIDETHLANEAARWAAVNGSPCNSGSLQQCILSTQAETAELRNNASVCIVNPDGQGYTVGHPVQVKVQYVYTWLPWFPDRLGFPTSTRIGAEATMRLEANIVPGANVGTCV